MYYAKRQDWTAEDQFERNIMEHLLRSGDRWWQIIARPFGSHSLAAHRGTSKPRWAVLIVNAHSMWFALLHFVQSPPTPRSFLWLQRDLRNHFFCVKWSSNDKNHRRIGDPKWSSKLLVNFCKKSTVWRGHLSLNEFMASLPTIWRLGPW